MPADPGRPDAAGRHAPARPARRRIAGVAAVLAFVPAGWVLSAALFGGDRPGGAGDGAAELFRPAAALALPGPHTTFAAHALGDALSVRRRPRSGARRRTLRARVLDGRTLPLVMLVVDRRQGWVKVQLPTRPNGSTGWVRRRAVRLRQNEWRLRVDLSDHTVTTHRGERRISVHRIAVGRAVTPTPHGRYYLTDLVQPPDPDGLYGSFAFGLSAHSKVVTRFGTGDGQIGIHGTDDAGVLGTDVSHGCIRVGNSVIESFARHLPLGTPVTIQA